MRHDHPLQPPSEGKASDIALAAAKEAARQTVSDLFGTLGVNVADYREMQALRDDITFLRKFRKGSTKMGGAFFMAMAGAAAIGTWELIKGFFNHH